MRPMQAIGSKAGSRNGWDGLEVSIECGEVWGEATCVSQEPAEAT